jgi:branched-chain amino acid transport system ATP-binding protein
MLEVKDVSTFYGNIQALKKISLTIPAGEMVTIVGANGAGKSTLLRTISGLIPAKTGSIIYEGRELTTLSPVKIVALGISHVPEGRQLFFHLTVLDNLHLGAYLGYHKLGKEQLKERLNQVYQVFPVLQQRHQQLAGTLSGGEQQMLAIGRALMSRPKLLILDEPSMGLAPLLVAEIFAVIKQLNKNGTTILLVEQNALASLRIADYGYVLETGQVVLEGPARQILQDRRVLQAYLGK